MQNNSNITWTPPKGQEWIGVIVTLTLFILGIIIVNKNSKKEGFWYGFGALFLLSAYVFTSKGEFGFRTAFFSVEPTTVLNEADKTNSNINENK
jgi:hypothetical protein